MIDIEKQIAYWRAGAEEDLEVGRDLLASGKTRHGLFFVHLALEKALKAILCRVTRDTPPRVHNLVRLSELAGIHPTPTQMDVLADMNLFQIEGRYPNLLLPLPSSEEAEREIIRAEEVFQWLIKL